MELLGFVGELIGWCRGLAKPICGLALPVAVLVLVLTSGSATALTAGSSGAAAAAPSASGLHVVPAPGTPDAAPASEIIFSSLVPGDLQSVSVRGSRSGDHAGHVMLLPDHAGTAFFPDRHFTPGEHVEVTAALTSARAGTASGDPGASTIHFSFTVAVLAGPPPFGPGRSGASAARSGTAHGLPRATLSFHSEPNLHPPQFRITSHGDRGAGEILLTPNHSFQRGPMILDGRGRLVWFQPTGGGPAYNLEVQRYGGRPALTWWQGGIDQIADKHYHVIATVRGQNGLAADVHEFQVTPQGTALINAYEAVHKDLSPYGGPKNGTIQDCVIQEIDIRTGQLLWEWHCLGHIPISASFVKPPAGVPWDPFHLNAIQQLPDGNLLISTRNTWGVYWINHTTSNIIWTLGGKYSSFKVHRGARFEWQHDPHLIGNTLTVFDDADNPQEEPQSSAKQIVLNTHNMTASLRRRYNHSPSLLADVAGSAQTLPDGNVFVGWGAASAFSEYARSGKQIFDGTFALGVYSYRVYRFPWTGQPLTSPVLSAAAGPGGKVTVYASWNGATEVSGWRVLAGQSTNHLSSFDRAAWTNFETALPLHSEPRYFVVQALDANGRVLGTSSARLLPAHVVLFGNSAFVAASSGDGAVPVGCYTGRACRFQMTIKSGRTVIATASSKGIAHGSGRLMYFRLSSVGRAQLNRVPAHGLRVRVTVLDSSGAKAVRSLRLFPFSSSGLSRRTTFKQGRALRIAQSNAFVSADHRVSVLAGCFASKPCEIAGSLSVNGTIIGSTAKPQHVGAKELGRVFINLNSAGRSKVAADSGNALGAQLKLTNRGAKAAGTVNLIRYG